VSEPWLADAADDNPTASDESGEPICQATLTLQSGAEEGRTYTLHGGSTTLGRSPDNDIVLDDATVSRRHCRVYWREIAYVLEDLTSSNGTYLNRERIQIAFLYSGDTLQIGEQVLRFTLVG
jgi:pSer/pThr/pTyr-binding forkhead associated (FHA) protein